MDVTKVTSGVMGINEVLIGQMEFTCGWIVMLSMTVGFK